MFFDHTVFYDIWSLKVGKTTEILTGSSIAARAVRPTLGTTALDKADQVSIQLSCKTT